MIRRGGAGRIGSYLAWRKPAGVLELTGTERDLISQIKATDGERLAAIEVRHMRPDCTPREALVTVLTLRGEDVFRTPAGHVLTRTQLAPTGNRRRRMDILQWSRHHRCFHGQGDFDLTNFATHVIASVYNGPWSLKVLNDVFRHSDTRRTASDARRSLLYLKEQVAETPNASNRTALFDVPSLGKY
ncbi:hypothetical protein ACIGKR_30445 [Rhodococcus qingshengii]|uniref:hypothetical protein n=1 Tax=Rhodococcus qingshengii TaxID=334542 RepID=UPI0037CC7A25